MAKKQERAPLSPGEEKKLLAQGNRLFQKEKQLERLGQMVRDDLLGNKAANQIIVQAAKAAFDRARQAQDIIRAWGDEAGQKSPMEQDEPGLEFTLQPFCDEVLRLSQLGMDAAADKIMEKFA